VKLTRTTTYLGGHLVRLGCGKDPRGLPVVNCRAEGCLFLAGSAGKALVFLEGSDAEERQVEKRFKWDGGPNGYGGYMKLREQKPVGEEMAPPPVDRDKWKNDNPGEDRSVFGVKLASALPAEVRYTQLKPGQLRPARDREMEECGVPATVKLPDPGR
jgi:hypothetical protein